MNEHGELFQHHEQFINFVQELSRLDEHILREANSRR